MIFKCGKEPHVFDLKHICSVELINAYLSDFGKHVLHSPNLTFASQAVFTAKLQLLV